MLSETEQVEKSDPTSIFDLLFIKNPNNISDDAPIFSFDEKRFTFGELRSLIRTCAFNLKERYNIQKGDVVAIRSYCHINYPIVVHATVFLGGTVAFVKQCRENNLESISAFLEKVEAKLFIIDNDGQEFSLQVASKAGVQTSQILMLGNSCIEKGIDGVSDILLSGEDPSFAPYIFNKEERVTHPLHLQFTSGTTGNPKTIMVACQPILSALESFYPNPNRINRMLANNPFYFGSSNFQYMYLPLILGSQVFISRANTVDQICHDIQKYKITTLPTLPIYISSIIEKSDYVKKNYDLSSLKRVYSISGLLTKEMIKAAMEVFGVPVTNRYGISEVRSPFDTTPEISARGSIGRVKPGYSVRIVDEEGFDVEIGKPGELLIKGPTVIVGYYKDPVETAKAFKEDGYFHTGDAVMKDEEGLYYFISRCSYKLKYNQTTFYPSEIEHVVLSHPKVRDCAVVGVSRKDLGGDHARAYVTLFDKAKDDDKDTVAKDILEFTNSQLDHERQLRAGVVIKKEFVKTPTGKIRYNVLKDEIERENGNI